MLNINSKEIYSLGNVMKWGAVIGALFIIVSFSYGDDLESFAVNFLMFIGIGSTAIMMIHFVVGIIGGSIDAGNSTIIAYFNARINDSSNYGKGYPAFRFALVIMSSCSGLTTWYGISNFLISKSDSIIRVHILPALMAIGVTLVVYSLWNRLFVLVSSDILDKRKKIKATFCYPLVGAVIIFTVSTVTSVLGMGGKEAVKQHYLVSITEYKQALSKITEYRKYEVSGVTLLSRYALKYSNAHEEEISGKGRTEAKGKGAVASFLKDASNEFSSANRTLESSNNNVVSLHKSINATLNKMTDDLMKTDMDIVEIEKTMEESLESVRQDMLELRNQSPLPALKSLTTYLKHSKKDFENLSGNKEIASMQKKALAYYNNLIDLTADDVNNIIKPLEEREMPELPNAQRINPIKAIFTYWEDIASFWAIAIAIDFWVLLWLILFFDFGRKEIMFDTQDQYDRWLESQKSS